MAAPTYLPARIVISIPERSYDGNFWGRYPLGNKPGPGMFATAQVGVAASGTLQGGSAVLAGGADVASAVSGILSGGSTSTATAGYFGHYVSQQALPDDGAAYRAAGNTWTGTGPANTMATIAGTGLRGMLIGIKPYDYEPTGNGPGDPNRFAGGRAMLSSLFALAASHGLVIWLREVDRSFGPNSNGAVSSNQYPTWCTTGVNNGSNTQMVIGLLPGGNNPGNLQAIMTTWNTTADANGNLASTLMSDHAADIMTQFAGVAGFAGLIIGDETAMGASGTNYNETNYISAWEAALTRASNISKKVPLRWEINYFGSGSGTPVVNAFQFLKTLGNGVAGGPDPNQPIACGTLAGTLTSSTALTLSVKWPGSTVSVPYFPATINGTSVKCACASGSESVTFSPALSLSSGSVNVEFPAYVTNPVAQIQGATYYTGVSSGGSALPDGGLVGEVPYQQETQGPYGNWSPAPALPHIYGLSSWQAKSSYYVWCLVNFQWGLGTASTPADPTGATVIGFGEAINWACNTSLPSVGNWVAK